MKYTVKPSEASQQLAFEGPATTKSLLEFRVIIGMLGV